MGAAYRGSARAALVHTAFLLLAFLGAPSSSTAQGLADCEGHFRYGVPGDAPTLLCRLGYALSHDDTRKVPRWVAYHLTKEHMSGTERRSNDFRPDPDLEPGERAELADYAGSGYDRGHMAPAGAMKWSRVAMSESFLLSNMAPQIGIGFNRHIWKSLETKVRAWTKSRGELYVVTGPVFSTTASKVIGQGNVAVPTQFFKVIFDPVRVEAIAFVLPHEKLPTKDLPNYLATVDEVEALTGLDFLSRLDDEVEKVVESRKPGKMWQ